MEGFFPEYSFERVFVDPWVYYPWVVVLGFFTAVACGLVGNYVVLRRMALVGDAISHSVLPGIVVAFLVFKSGRGVPMYAGALAAGLATTWLIDVIHRKSRIKQDAAIGITFTVLFSIGVILIKLFADHVDIDPACVLFGELEQVGEPVRLWGMTLPPGGVLRMGGIALGVFALVMLFYKELLVTSFDPVLATSLGVSSRWVHRGLMVVLTVVVVGAFEAVGSILVIAMLILPAATSLLVTDRLKHMVWITLIHAALSSVVGVHLGAFLNVRTGATVVLAGTGLFVLAWLFSPLHGVVGKLWRRRGDGSWEVEEGGALEEV